MKNRNERREEMGAYATMVAIGLIVITLIFAFIFKL